MTREEWKRQRRWDIAKRIGAVVGLLLIAAVIVLVCCGCEGDLDVEPDHKAFMARVRAGEAYDEMLEKTGSYAEAERCYIVAYEEALAHD